MKSSKTKNMSFESCLNQLEEIVEQLESGNVDLEKLVELYEKGIAILNHFRGSNRDAPIQAPSSYAVMPGLHRLVAEWAFGGTWDRSGLEIKYRSIATISALTVLGREPQLKNHIRAIQVKNPPPCSRSGTNKGGFL